MVGRRGRKKTSKQRIAPGRLESKQNTHENKNINPSITDEIAPLLGKKRRGYTTNISRPSKRSNVIDHVSEWEVETEDSGENTNVGDETNNSTEHSEPNHVLDREVEFEDSGANTNIGNGTTYSTEYSEPDQASHDVVSSMDDEDLLGKGKRESNFVGRLEVGLQQNKALDPPQAEISSPNEVEPVIAAEITSNTATSKTKGRGKRGMYRSHVVDMKIKERGAKLRVTIPDDIDRAIGENARHLVNECGRVVRTRAPYNVNNWNEAFEVAGDSMLKEIQDKFEFPQSDNHSRIYTFVVETMKRLYRLFKCRLHNHYKKCGQTDDERKNNPPPDLPQSQWEYLIKHYGSDKFKAASERNSRNRKSNKRAKHTTGNLSFPESEHILRKKNGNVKPSADRTWLIQHTHENDAGQLEWLSGDSRSKEIHENFKNVGAFNGDSMTQEEYIRGKGIGIRGFKKGKAQAEQSRIVQQQEKIKEQEQKIKELEESQLRQQREFEESELKRQQEFEAYKAQQQKEMETFKETILQQLLQNRRRGPRR